MAELESKIMSAMKVAMKAKDQGRLRALRAVKSAILLQKTDGSGKDLDEAGEIALLQKLVKQRQDSLAIYEEQNREDLAVKEKEEIEAIMDFLPKQLSPEELTTEIEKIVAEVGATSMKHMGKVMGLANKKLAGSADGKSISMVVKSLLS